MRKYLIPILLLLVFIFIPLGMKAETLHDYFINNYGKVPAWEDRTKLAKECGIDDYLADKSQNISLLSCLKKKVLSLGGQVTQDIMLGGLVTKPYTFVPNTVIKSAEVNADFDTLYSLVNGQISDPNISNTAAINRTKINGTAIVSTGATSQTINSATTTINGTLLINTTNGYLRAPVMTIAQRDALGSVEAGAIIYASDAGQFYVREGGTWSPISPAAATANANTTTKGIVEEADITELSNNTGTGATGARLYINPELSASSTTGTPDAHKVMRLRSDGHADASFGGVTTSLATLDSNIKVVQNPASSTSTPTVNSIPISPTTTAELARGWIPFKFGGDCSDGALTISSGTTTINLGGAAVFTKNYSSISITGTGALAFSNPSSAGTLIIMRDCGDFTVTSTANPTIDLRNIGAVGGSGGAPGTGSDGSTATNWIAGLVSGGYGGLAGTAGNDGGGGAGGSSSSGIGESGHNGSGGTLGGAAGTSSYFNSASAPFISLYARPGSGGGGGGSGNNSGANGSNGGRGAGGLSIEVKGSLIFSGVINANGTVGNNGLATMTNFSGSGGGGGGGTVTIIANTITTNTGTISTSGGVGGLISGNRGQGGTGADGFGYVGKNINF